MKSVKRYRVELSAFHVLVHSHFSNTPAADCFYGLCKSLINRWELTASDPFMELAHFPGITI